RPAFRHDALAAATEHLQAMIGVSQDRRLNRPEVAAIVQRSALAPRLSQVSAPLDMNAPAVIFGAGWRQDGSVAQLDRLFFFLAEDAPRVGTPRGPGLG